MNMTHEERIKSAGIELPPVPKPAGVYRPAVISGNLLFLSGQGPRLSDGTFPCGVVGEDFTIEEAQVFARLTGLALLASARAELGSLDRVVRVVRVLGMVRATPDFGDQPKVINGCSDLFLEVFGEAGRGARSAVGMGSLPRGIPVEIEAIFEIGPNS